MRPAAATVLHASAQNISIAGCVWLLPVYRIPSLFSQFASLISGKDAAEDTPGDGLSFKLRNACLKKFQWRSDLWLSSKCFGLPWTG